MKVIEVTEFGPPSVLHPTTAPDVNPGPGEILVAVTHSGVLSLDVVIRSGKGGDLFPTETPYVPGVGVAGDVIELGPGVDESLSGSCVVAEVDSGGYAERVVARVDDTVAVPPGVEPADALGLLHDGSTALSLFTTAGVQAGDRMFVQPAAGGLGSLLVQLGHHAGAHVTAAAGGDEKLAAARRLGADELVDYSQPRWSDALGPFDVVFDGVGGDLGRGSYNLLAEGGRFSAYGFAGGAPVAVDLDEAKARGHAIWGIDQLNQYAEDRPSRVSRLLEMLARGEVHPLVGAELPLDRAAEAHRMLESRAVIGKILLRP